MAIRMWLWIEAISEPSVWSAYPNNKNYGCLMDKGDLDVYQPSSPMTCLPIGMQSCSKYVLYKIPIRSILWTILKSKPYQQNSNKINNNNIVLMLGKYSTHGV